jgi:hypothetical protein
MKALTLMNRKIQTVIIGIVFFIIMYLVISYSFYKDAVVASEQHIIKNSRMSLGEVSDRMEAFLLERCNSLKVLTLFEEIRNCISTGDFKFMHKTSLMSLDDNQIFMIFDANGNSIMVEPEKYRKLFLGKKFAAEQVAMLAERRLPGLISRAIPVQDLQKGGGMYFVFVFAPMRNPDNSFGGIAGLGFNVQKLFHDYFKPIYSNYEGSIVCITDDQGNIEMFNNSSVIMKNTSLTPELLPRIPEEIRGKKYEGYYVWTSSERKKYLIIYHPIDTGSHTWVAQLRIPYSTISQDLAPFYWKLSLLLIILLLVAMIGIFIAISAGKQIRQLKKQIIALEIEIDYEKKKAAVDGIISSDYFRNLKEQARNLKKME